MSKLIKTDAEYARWIHELKERYRSSQIKAATRVNQEMLRFYWSLGRDIVARDAENKYGTGFYKLLSQDLKDAIPEAEGFSRQNLQYMKKMYLLYSHAAANNLLAILRERYANKLLAIYPTPRLKYCSLFRGDIIAPLLTNIFQSQTMMQRCFM